MTLGRLLSRPVMEQGAYMAGLDLASVIRQLRAELNEAMDDAGSDRLRFELGPIELSLTVTVSKDATPGAKIRFWVVEAGADAKVSRESAQEIKLVLTRETLQCRLALTVSRWPQ